jgi:hypothetical protein
MESALLRAAVLVGVFFAAVCSASGVPGILHFQGFLQDDLGNPLNGTYSVTFAVYDVESGGSPLWAEATEVDCKGGLFDVILGLVNPIGLSFSGQYWLGVGVSGDPEMTPRYELSSVPYAFWSAVSDSSAVSGRSSSSAEADVALTAGVCDSAQTAAHADYADASNSAQNAVHAAQADVADSANGIRWGSISGMPGGFADGVDDTGAGAGDGHSLDGADGSPVDVVYVDNDGDVGIGTTSPSTKLEVAGGGLFDMSSGDINITTPGGWPGLIAYSTNNHRRDITFDNDRMYMTLSSTSSAPSNSNGIAVMESGNVGIGVFTPTSRLHVNGTMSVGDDGSGYDVRLYGGQSGSRFLWDAADMALEIGKEVMADSFSVAIGCSVDAFGRYCFAAGREVDAVYNFSAAFGCSTDAVGKYSFGAGISSDAVGEYSAAFGWHTGAIGNGAFAAGKRTNAVADYTAAFGCSTVAVGVYSFVAGQDCDAVGDHAFAAGHMTSAVGKYSVALGNKTTANALRSTAIGDSTHALGKISFASGRNTFASGMLSTAMGDYSQAPGAVAVAMNVATHANGDGSVAMGAFTVASGEQSLATGNNTTAGGTSSVSMGSYTMASGEKSVSMGRWTTAGPNPLTFVIGDGVDNLNRLTNNVTGSLVVGFGDTSATFFVGGTNNNVGVGTRKPSPETSIHVRGLDDNFGILVDALGVMGTEIGLHAADSYYSGLVKNAYWNSGWQRFDDTHGAFLQQVDPNGNVSFYLTESGSGTISWTQAMSMTNTGKVGVGAGVTPSRTLDVLDVMRLRPSGQPASGAEGDIYMDSTTHKLRVHNGTTWVDLH